MIRLGGATEKHYEPYDGCLCTQAACGTRDDGWVGCSGDGNCIPQECTGVNIPHHGCTYTYTQVSDSNRCSMDNASSFTNDTEDSCRAYCNKNADCVAYYFNSNTDDVHKCNLWSPNLNRSSSQDSLRCYTKDP
jgi:hypothetical protein